MPLPVIVCIALCAIAMIFLIGYKIGYTASKKRHLGRVEWVKKSSLKNDEVYTIMGRVHLHSNLFAVIVRDGAYNDYAVLVAEFDLPHPAGRYVRVDESGRLVTAYPLEISDPVPTPENMTP